MSFLGISQPPYPDEQPVAIDYQPEPELEHKELAAETETITDQGIFRALVSTNSEDRERDVVASGAFSATITRWRRSGKSLPLAVDHSTAPEDVVGVIDPAQMEEQDLGLVVGGKVDLESPRGPAAWRAMKSGSFGFSIGYLVQDSRSRGRGKGRILTAVDLFEISLTATPAVFDTRVLELKSATAPAETDDDLDSLDLDQLRERSMAAIADIDLKSHRPVQVASFPC